MTTDLTRPTDKLTIGSPEEIVGEAVDDSPLYEHVAEGMQFLSNHFDLVPDVSTTTLVTYALDEADLTPNEVSGLFVAFVKSPELRDCLKYNRDPTPRDFLEVADRKADRPIITDGRDERR